ncbi:HNH endonuclease [Desulfobacula sp.]|uniref:HNH endonuclease n=1 Tax=Desulfobacula sp. TaxID=2593537 RepID=UPI001ECD9F7E|nr:HNH endonuclease [Desulfobacula sp.]
MGRNWTEYELLMAMNLYCRLPFGQFDQSNEYIRKVAEKMDRTPSSLSMKLCNLASLDSYHQDRGVVGLKGASNLDRKVWTDFQQNWSAMAEKSETAFEVLMDGIGSKEPAHEVEQPSGPSEVERTVKTRRLQTFFRNAVLASYENRCVLTGMAIPQLLVASHIIPWSENEERRADPTNGLCLNVLHDKAFDRHLITFDENYRLVVSSILKKGDIPEFQSSNFAKLEGTTIVLPHRFAPDFQALEEHRNAFVA